jgi:drug/metabolite transporter (DMT)-like permease
VASLLLLPFGIRDMRRHLQAGGPRFGWKNLPRLILLSLVGVILNNVLLYNGAALAPATDASLLAITETLFTALLAWVFLREHFPLLKILGLALGAFGVYILVAQGFNLPQLSGSNQTTGDLLLLGGFAFESLYTLLGASSARRFPPLALIAATNLVGLVFWGPSAVVSLQAQNWQMPTIDWQGLAALAYLIVICSVVGYAVWFKTLRRAEASMASVTLFVQPLAGSIVGFLLLGEILTIFNLIGGILVVVSLGLLVISTSKKCKQPTKDTLGTPASIEYVALGNSDGLPERVEQVLHL